MSDEVPTHSGALRFRRTLSVRVGEDDGSGLLFFAALFRYVGDGEQEVFDRLGLPAWQQIRSGTAAPMVHLEADYSAPIRAGDVVRQEIAVEAGRRASLHFGHRFIGPSGLRVASVQTVHCWVALNTMTSVPTPSEVAGNLKDPNLQVRVIDL